jgi:hypothetical protein
MNNTKKKQNVFQRQHKRKKKTIDWKMKSRKQVQRWQGDFTKIMTQHQC